MYVFYIHTHTAATVVIKFWQLDSTYTAAGDNVFENALRMHLIINDVAPSLTDDETNP